MGAAATTLISRDEYLRTEYASVEKHEYYGGKVVAMAGASYEHILITGNLYGRIFGLLTAKNGSCRILGNDMRVRIDEDVSYIYPDLTLICGAANLSFERPPALLNPLIIIEILSSSIEDKDRSVKLPRLMRKMGLQEIILVNSQFMLVEHFVRQGEEWVVRPFLTNPDDVLHLQAVDVTVSLEDIYRDVVFPLMPTY